MNRCILENLKRIMILLRSDIRNRRGRELVHLFRQAFQSQMSNGELCGEMMEMMPEWCSWLSCGETPARDEVWVQEELAAFISQALEVMEETLHADEFEMAYDLADMLHVVPDVIVKNDKMSMKKLLEKICSAISQKMELQHIS